jgi:hypothetical protein
VLKAFREDPNVRVLLMSLKAGGVALNYIYNFCLSIIIYLLTPILNLFVFKKLMKHSCKSRMEEIKCLFLPGPGFGPGFEFRLPKNACLIRFSPFQAYHTHQYQFIELPANFQIRIPTPVLYIYQH